MHNAIKKLSIDPATHELKFDLLAKQNGIDTLILTLFDTDSTTNGGVDSKQITVIINTAATTSLIEINGSIDFADVNEDFVRVINLDTTGIQIVDPDGGAVVVTTSTKYGFITAGYNNTSKQIDLTAVKDSN